MLSLAARLVSGTMLIASSVASAAAAEKFAQTGCRSGECVWSAISAPFTIARRETGSLVGVTSRFCVEPNGKFPNNYQCQRSTILTEESVANCSTHDPSIAVRDPKGKWQRMRLSISSDGEYGYNRETITNYLRICHGYAREVRGGPSLDMIGAKYGYKNRYGALGDKERDTVDQITDLAQ